MARNRVQTWGAALLLLTALIWGMAFVAQSVGMDYLGPCAFNGVRSLIGGVALLPVIALSACCSRLGCRLPPRGRRGY